MKFKEYKAAKNTNWVNIGLAIIITSSLGVLIGWIYSVMVYIPIIYLNILIVIGVGYLLGISNTVLSKLLQIRDKRTRLLLIVLSVFVAYYSQWISFILQTYSEQFPSIGSYLSYWIYPQQFFDAIAEINNYGTWGFGMSDPIYVRDIFLSIIWFGEAVILFFVSIAYVYRFPENPFSEKFNKWYPKIVLDEEFENVYSTNRFISQFEEQGIDKILNLKNGLAFQYSKVSIFYIEGEDKQYLSIEYVQIDKREPTKSDTTVIVKPFEISTQDAKALFGKFEVKKEFYLNY